MRWRTGHFFKPSGLVGGEETGGAYFCSLFSLLLYPPLTYNIIQSNISRRLKANKSVYAASRVKIVQEQ